MQPGSPGPGQDPYQQNPYNQYPPNYGQVPQYPDPFSPQSSPPYDPTGAGSPYPPDPFAPPSSPVQPPQEYSLYAEPAAPPPPVPVPQYPAAGYSVPPMPPPMMAMNQNNNTFGLLSMIFGIVALPMLCCFYTGAAIGIGAVVLGIVGLQKANRGEADNKGMAIAGIVCGGIAGFLGLLWIIAVAAFHFATPTYS